jgi:DNA anti-recombination protein RmuC
MLAFNTLNYAKKLKSVGFTDQQAEAQAEGMAEVIDYHLASKQDLSNLELSLKHEIQNVDHKIDKAVSEFRLDLSNLETSLKHEIQVLEHKIDTVATELNHKIDDVEAKLDKKIATAVSELNHKIDTSAARVEVSFKNDMNELGKKVNSLAVYTKINLIAFTSIIGFAITTSLVAHWHNLMRIFTP